MMMESMKSMTREDFDTYFGSALTWSVTLSNGHVVNLTPSNGDQSSSRVSYDDRMEYARMVEEARMNECKQQV
jgi:hypothetical protein